MGEIQHHPGLLTVKSKLPRLHYEHPNLDERYQIAIFAETGRDQSDIARVVNCHKLSIGREIKRNGRERGCWPKRTCENSSRLVAETLTIVAVKKSAQNWYPGQISLHLEVNGQSIASHKSINQRIYADKRAGVALHTLHRLRARSHREHHQESSSDRSEEDVADSKHGARSL